MSTTVVDEEFRRRLRLIMQQFGSVADLARAVEVSDNAIYKWVSGRGQPSMASLVNLARAAGVSVEWLATGKGASGKVKMDSQNPARADEYQATARQVMRGAGKAVQSSQFVDYLTFQPEWLQRTLQTDAKNLALIEVVGDSMSPTIDGGDIVIVDLREVRFRHDGIYALRMGGELAVKRLQRQPDGSILVRSDNPAYVPTSAPIDSLALVGRAMWMCGRL
jgi:phage repressor protein C with HTH and peptisase S24 domain